MCLRSWIKDAMENVLSGVLTETSDTLDAIGRELLVVNEKLDGLSSWSGDNSELQNLIRWSIVKPPMSIWGDAHKKGNEAVLDIYLRGEQLRSFWTEKGFGLRVSFPGECSFKLVKFGEQLRDWVATNANAEGDILTVAGFAGDPENAIDPGDSIVHLCTLYFSIDEPIEVVRFMIFDLVDDLEAFNPKEMEYFTIEP